MTSRNCRDCGCALTQVQIAGRQYRCGPCRWNGIRKYGTRRAQCVSCDRRISVQRTESGETQCLTCKRGEVRKAKPKPVPAYLRCKPGNCQICNNWDASYTAPDGTNVPCCKGCYFTTMALVEREAKRKGKTAVITARGLVFR